MRSHRRPTIFVVLAALLLALAGTTVAATNVVSFGRGDDAPSITVTSHDDDVLAVRTAERDDVRAASRMLAALAAIVVLRTFLVWNARLPRSSVELLVRRSAHVGTRAPPALVA